MTPALLWTRLTDRQREALQLAATGLGNREIAERLGCSLGTVKAHLLEAYRRLDVSSREEAYIALGWLAPPRRT